MNAVWKYRIPVNATFRHSMPRGFRIVKVGIQDDMPYFWALVNTEAPLEVTVFVIYGTGHLISSLQKLGYVDTFRQGPFVWHLFVERQKEVTQGKPKQTEKIGGA